MPLARLPVPFDHPDWLFELKYDGFRALAYVDNGNVQFVSRKGNIYKSFANLCAALAQTLTHAVLDGEIVNIGSDGKPQFYDLLTRRSPQQFVAFDVLWHDGRDLRNLPLIERKRILRRIIPKETPCLLYADYIEARGVAMFRRVCEMDLEGIVAKRKDGLYTPEETTWVKIRNPHYSQMEGRRELFEKRLSASA
jgi:bifunctional non-homologous end joining protein LigD